MKKESFIIMILIFFVQVQSLTFVELFGMGDLLQDLAKLKVSSLPGADPQISTAYMLDPSIYTFLRQFPSRTQFCEYKCISFFNLPCFILFSCNIQIRNFILIFVIPLFLLAMIGVCCGRGIWTFKCFFKYIAVFTGIAFLLWAIKKCSQGGNIRNRKKQQKKIANQQQQKKAQEKYNIEGDQFNLETADRCVIKSQKSSQQ